jgi:hypothetical protein
MSGPVSAPVPPSATGPVVAGDGGGTSAPTASEQSLLGRFVAILTPVFALLAGWLAAWVGNHVPGLTLNQPEIATFMATVVTTVLASAWKWLQGWQQHEWLVAQGRAVPRKPGPAPAPAIPLPRNAA